VEDVIIFSLSTGSIVYGMKVFFPCSKSNATILAVSRSASGKNY
jgi:hypothetical protein